MMNSMQRRVRLAAVILPVLMVASAGCDIAMADFKEKQSAEWSKTYELPAGGRFELNNVNGRIKVQPGTGNTIEVKAEKTARAASVEGARQALERVEIQESVTSSGVTVTTRVPHSGMFNGGNVDVRYTVRVPAGADVKFTTVNGGIEVTGLTGRLQLEATNGGIKANAVSGYVDASTTNGGVEVDLAKLDKDGVKLGCTNGGIELHLPAEAAASIDARVTNGGIAVHGLQIDTEQDPSKRRLSGRMNGGGPRVEIEGTNGGIRLAAR